MGFRFVLILTLAAAGLFGQDSISIEDYNPKSLLVVPEHHPVRAKFPFIDIHTHHRESTAAGLQKLQQDMDSLNMRIMVNSPVNGGAGEPTRTMAAAMRAFNKDRFVTMTNIDFNNLEDPEYGKKAATKLEEDIKAGAVGLKVWKNFGLTMKDSKGRIHVDDPRFDPVWAMCAKYKIPVLIHTADPKGLFMPMDKDNERWLELKIQSRRNQSTQTDYTWEQIIQEQHNLFKKNKNTIFIDAHLGWLGFDLGRLGELLDACPNVYTEIGAVTSELGRQPRFAKQFLTKYQDRVLFGKDAYNVAEYPVYFRLLETDDEYFDPIRKYHGIWKLYGLDLSDEVLKKIYYKNALRIVPGLNPAGFPN